MGTWYLLCDFQEKLITESHPQSFQSAAVGGAEELLVKEFCVLADWPTTLLNLAVVLFGGRQRSEVSSTSPKLVPGTPQLIV